MTDKGAFKEVKEAVKGAQFICKALQRQNLFVHSFYQIAIDVVIRAIAESW